MKMLVAYGSKRGGTEGLAQMVAEGLRAEGFTVDVAPARGIKEIDGYDAVVVGGALYALRWHRDAHRFVKRHVAALRERPTYFFSSGPLDDTAADGDIPPTKGVAALMAQVGAKGHATFGGRLAADAKGFPASAMAKKHAGDWRDPERVRAWTRLIGSELEVAPHR
jgi:menaquinone-dependent protoporphyrinogen oxidase